MDGSNKSKNFENKFFNENKIMLILSLINDDFLRSTGKIYVVVACLVVVFLVLVVYLVSMDRKLKKIEGGMHKKKI